MSLDHGFQVWATAAGWAVLGLAWAALAIVAFFAIALLGVAAKDGFARLRR